MYCVFNSMCLCLDLKKAKQKIFVRPGLWVLFVVYSLFGVSFLYRWSKMDVRHQGGQGVRGPQEIVCPEDICSAETQAQHSQVLTF